MGLPELHGGGQRHRRGGCCFEPQFIIRADFAGGDDAPVPAGQAVFGDVGGHAVAGKALIDFPARVAGLADLQAGAAELVNVADMNIVFIEIGGGNVFAKTAR